MKVLDCLGAATACSSDAIFEQTSLPLYYLLLFLSFSFFSFSLLVSALSVSLLVLFHSDCASLSLLFPLNFQQCLDFLILFCLSVFLFQPLSVFNCLHRIFLFLSSSLWQTLCHSLCLCLYQTRRLSVALFISLLFVFICRTLS